jgi:rfaE bifunctional protein kinase chain/domain
MMLTLGLDRLEEILTRAGDLRVAVIGDLMLDIYLSGSVQRISPEAPVPVVQVAEETSALGGAGNVAANVLRLGAACDIVGLVGTDSAGEMIRRSVEALEGGEVRARLVATADRPTTTKTRVMARHQQVVRFDRERDDDADSDLASRLSACVREAVAEADVVVLEDYNKGVLAPAVIRAAIDSARDSGVPIIVDPKFRNIFEYRGATLFKPNSLELTSALGVPIRCDDDDWLQEARMRFECEHLLVTLGEQGMVVSSETGATFRVPAIARQVYDVSGAGDTVTAFMAVALGAGADIQEATILSNFAAAIEVGKPGVATVAPEELRELIGRHHAEAVIP